MPVRHIYLHATVKRCWVHLRVCVCVCAAANVIRQVSGQSNSLSNDWFIIWLTGILPPLLSSPFFPIICHPFHSFSSPPPPCCMHSSDPFTPSHLVSSASPSNVLFAFTSFSFLSTLPPSCLSLDDINTSSRLCCDHITWGNAAHNHTPPPSGSVCVWVWVCVCVNSFLNSFLFPLWDQSPVLWGQTSLLRSWLKAG